MEKATEHLRVKPSTMRRLIKLMKDLGLRTLGDVVEKLVEGK